MSGEIVIRAESLGKKYIIGHEREGGYTALRDVLARSVDNLWRKTADMVRGRGVIVGDWTEEVWALKDIDFEVARGDVLGIIGGNGAGKSTLLKILSRITEPTEGRVTIKGRVASLLEVGTGFHPELTGRENIYLNGAVLGMTRTEIKRKFDEIVDFSGVEKFLDTPVKRYSSGMSVRLAFSVAAHLEPEILVVDEVLAVGDAEFQKKCLGKMSEVAGGGRTVLFVSHNMHAVERLCRRVIVLKRGGIVGTYSEAREGIRIHLSNSGSVGGVPVWQRPPDFPGNGYFEPQELRISSAGLDAQDHGPFSNEFDINLDVIAQIKIANPVLNIGITLYAEDGMPIFYSYITDTIEETWLRLRAGGAHLRLVIPRRLLNEGNYRVELIASLHLQRWLLEPGNSGASVSFSIRGGLSDSPNWHRKRPGVLAPVLRWQDLSCGGPIGQGPESA